MRLLSAVPFPPPCPLLTYPFSPTPQGVANAHRTPRVSATDMHSFRVGPLHHYFFCLFSPSCVNSPPQLEKDGGHEGDGGMGDSPSPASGRLQYTKPPRSSIGRVRALAKRLTDRLAYVKVLPVFPPIAARNTSGGDHRHRRPVCHAWKATGVVSAQDGTCTPRPGVRWTQGDVCVASHDYLVGYMHLTTEQPVTTMDVRILLDCIHSSNYVHPEATWVRNHKVPCVGQYRAPILCYAVPGRGRLFPGPFSPFLCAVPPSFHYMFLPWNFL